MSACGKRTKESLDSGNLHIPVQSGRMDKEEQGRTRTMKEFQQHGKSMSDNGSHSSATGQLGEQHPSKNMPAQSLNWHGASQADSLQDANFMTEQIHKLRSGAL